MKNTVEIFLMSVVGIVIVGLLAFSQFDVLSASTKEAQVQFVSTQYISAERLQRSGQAASYSDKYIARFELEGGMHSVTVDPNSYRKINKMKPENGPMDFTVVYKNGLFSKSPVQAQIKLNSNEQFRKME